MWKGCGRSGYGDQAILGDGGDYGIYIRFNREDQGKPFLR